MKILSNFLPPKESSAYNPAKSVEVQPGATAHLTMNGMGGERYGIRKILPFSANMNAILISARLNEDLYLFRGVQLSVVHNLFKSIDGLFAPFIIQKNNHIVFELTNTGAVKQTVNIQIVGYDQFALAKLSAAYQEIGASVPVPRFLYGHSTVPAGGLNIDLGVKSKSVDVQVRRMAMSSNQPGAITASMKVYNTTVRDEVFLEQVNDEFNDKYINVPFVVGSNVPFDVYASNYGAQPAEVSFLCESYVQANTGFIPAE
ncbi:MAG: hypothetical protein CL670_04435 [Balneola sp.]|nr:hypothetical protein [Balneola sp.]MBE78379.1 hypothetical protein [Balneola sp.]|tara:strand:- start:205 stop:981 length:777 start_codon:yes stop_codon:yes gene_type:complete